MILVLLALLYNQPLKAQTIFPWKNLDRFECQKELEHLIQEKSWQDLKFHQTIPERFHQTAYRSLSPKMGQGIEIQISSKELPVILNIHDQKISKYNFSKNCKWEVNETKMPWHLEKFFNNLEGNFSDYQLKKVVESKKPAIIYSWSPRYAYSVYDLPKIAKIAKNLNFDFYPVVDPRVDLSEVKDSLKAIETKMLTVRQVASHSSLAASLAKNISIELYFRGGFNHFPLTYIVSNHKINPRYIVGVMKDEGYIKMIKELAAELK